MKACMLTQVGLEGIAAQEAQDLLGVKACPDNGVVELDADLKQLYALTYRAQSVMKVMVLLAKTRYEDVVTALEASDIKDFVHESVSFACRAYAVDVPQSSMDIAADIGGKVQECTRARVDLEDPDVQVFVVATADHYYIGIDLAGIDLSKREYRVFQGLEYLRATTAFGAIKFSDYTSEKQLVDPFCRAGTIPIEAALFAMRYSPHFYTKDKLAFTKWGDFDTLFEELDDRKREEQFPIYAIDQYNRHISQAKKNAKIAGVNKVLTFSRLDLDWLETRLDEHSTDCVVTCPPERSKIWKESALRVLYEELFHQADYILKPGGNCTLIARDPTLLIEAAEKRSFQEVDRMKIAQGDEVFFVLKFERTTRETA